MGDRSYCTATIYACPAGREAEVLAALEDAGLGAYEPDEPATPALRLGEDYTAEESTLGSMESLADVLVELGATFRAVQDPHYTAPGDTHGNVPGLGRYDEDSSVEGQLLVREDHVLDALDRAAGPFDARRGVRKLFGWPILQVLTAAEEGHVLTVSAADGDSAEGTCSCGWGYASPDTDALADAFLDHAAPRPEPYPVGGLYDDGRRIVDRYANPDGSLLLSFDSGPTPVRVVPEDEDGAPLPPERPCEGSEGLATPYGPTDTWPAS